MQEKWSTIEEFPTYKIGTFGQVVNQSSGKILRLSETSSGVVKVGFFVDGERYTRSVALLVAHAFVFGRDDIFDTPIHLDGDQRNNRADNLVWRPRWFALRYSRQFADIRYHDRGPIKDLETGDWYDTVLSAAITNGFLINGSYSIIESVRTKESVWPTRKVFSFV